MGKKFKLEVWETCLKSMREKEVASFVVNRTVSENEMINVLYQLKNKFATLQILFSYWAILNICILSS